MQTATATATAPLTRDRLREIVATVLPGAIVTTHRSGFEVNFGRHAEHEHEDLGWLSGQLGPLVKVHGFTAQKHGGYVLVRAVR